MAFEKLMKDKFQMSSIGELTFFLGLKVQKKEDGIFISQDKYVAEIVKKFNYTYVKSDSTLVDLEKPLVKDGDADDVDVHLYRSMVDTWQCKKQTVVATSTTEAEHVKRGRDTKIPQSSGPLVKVGDEVVHKELGDRMEKATTTASSLEAEQDSDAQTRFETTSKQSNNPPLSRVNTLGCGEDSMKLIELMAHYTTLSELNLNSLSIHQMASLEFCDKHNMVVYLEKSKGSEGFHQIIDFLTVSHIKNALTKYPTLYASLIEQFWQTAALSTNEDGVRGITATIGRKVKVFVYEPSIRRHLKLEDSEGLKTLPTTEIFKQLALIGFIQIFLNKHKGMLFPYKKTFPTPTLIQKLFSNMKRASKGYSRVGILVFPTMLTTPESSPSRITSSPSLSPQTHSSTLQPPSTSPSNQITPVTEEAALMPHESPLQSVHSVGRNEGSLSLNELTDLCTSLSKKVEILESKLKQIKQTYNDALTKLIKRMKKLEQTIKTSQARRRAKVVISDDEEAEEDPSNQGRSLIEELDLDISDQLEKQLGVFSAATTLADAAKRRQSVENVQTYTRRRREVSTGSGGVSTASRLVSTADISTASELDSTGGVKAKYKGKAIMHESEPPKKIKKKLDEREEVAAKVDQAHDIDWSDPAILRYHTLQNRPFSVAEVRKNMFKEEIVQQDDVIAEQAVKESSRTAGWRRKKSLARKRAKKTLSEESAKKQKLEDDNEKEELQVSLNIVPEEEISILNHSQDVLELYRLVKERFQTASPEGYDLLL
ncbi:xylulose kinase-1 [Tanacetum coccineum]|uniref:Xylulose kinase-1 n=1 Tax=Tanacetum coccineum TaxID=301880 RepID=A0ABQ5GZ19_9ASTR